MFLVRADHVRRVSFATKLFPRLNSVTGVVSSNQDGISDNQFDGEVFCGGRSRNKDLLTYFGFLAESPGSSTFIQLPIFRRSMRKLTDLIESELESIGAQQVLLPTLIPQRLWSESGRLNRQRNALDHVFRFADDPDNPQILGPTFEESVTSLVADMPYLNQSDLPVLLYQTSQKFRYETNPRFGLLRTKEFLMNDLYSFDASREDAVKTYDRVTDTYAKIFDRLGIGALCQRIESDPGGIGGEFSHEYQLIVPSGEDTILRCNGCGHSFNIEMIQSDNHDSGRCPKCQSANLEAKQAMELGHTFLLSDIYSKPFKAKYMTVDGKPANFQMGCFGLGLSRIIGAVLDLYSTDVSTGERIRMRWPNQVEPFDIAIVAPAQRSKQFHKGSTQFIERLVNNILQSITKTDIYIEDRDKESIVRRLINLKILGFPHIIVVGSKFLDDPPEVEFLTMNQNKDYEQHWFTEEQVYSFLTKFYEKKM